MRRGLRRLVIALCALLLLAPPGALAFYKPSRILVPELFGVTCFAGGVCLDDASKLGEARELKHDAVAWLVARFGAFQSVPKMVFCATEACSSDFGMYHAAAYSVGTLGAVIKPKGWQPFYVRHELIHHLQNERIGTAAMFLKVPEWWREGMAYSLSQDPRRPIPNSQIEEWRMRFEVWNRQTSDDCLWQGPHVERCQH